MARASPLVVLVEDDDQNGARIEGAIRKALPKGFRFKRFEDHDPPSKGAYEDLVYAQLHSSAYTGLALIVTDRDLSKSHGYPGLSEAVISKAAVRLAVPVCIYAAGQGPDPVLQRQRSGGDSRIILDSADEQAMARKVASIVSGFATIARSLAKPRIARLRRKAQGPAMVLAQILGRPEISSQLSLYATGDQKMIAELMPVLGVTDEIAKNKRIPTVLGYWLYDSILRFPGILVNEIAAASYLDIHQDDFHQPKVQRLFREALYRGPFADSDTPNWWRDKLDDLLQKEKVNDGRTLVRRALKRSVRPCLDGKRRAGYYCVVTRKPVSKENSVGQISWLPRGADLSRVRQDVYDELAPWIGLS